MDSEWNAADGLRESEFDLAGSTLNIDKDIAIQGADQRRVQLPLAQHRAEGSTAKGALELMRYQAEIFIARS